MSQIIDDITVVVRRDGQCEFWKLGALAPPSPNAGLNDDQIGSGWLNKNAPQSIHEACQTFRASSYCISRGISALQIVKSYKCQDRKPNAFTSHPLMLPQSFVVEYLYQDCGPAAEYRLLCSLLYLCPLLCSWRLLVNDLSWWSCRSNLDWSLL